MCNHGPTANSSKKKKNCKYQKWKQKRAFYQTTRPFDLIILPGISNDTRVESCQIYHSNTSLTKPIVGVFKLRYKRLTRRQRFFRKLKLRRKLRQELKRTNRKRRNAHKVCSNWLDSVDLSSNPRITYRDDDADGTSEHTWNSSELYKNQANLCLEKKTHTRFDAVNNSDGEIASKSKSFSNTETSTPTDHLELSNNNLLYPYTPKTQYKTETLVRGSCGHYFSQHYFPSYLFKYQGGLSKLLHTSIKGALGVWPQANQVLAESYHNIDCHKESIIKHIFSLSHRILLETNIRNYTLSVIRDHLYKLQRSKIQGTNLSRNLVKAIFVDTFEAESSRSLRIEAQVHGSFSRTPTGPTTNNIDKCVMDTEITEVPNPNSVGSMEPSWYGVSQDDTSLEESTSPDYDPIYETAIKFARSHGYGLVEFVEDPGHASTKNNRRPSCTSRRRASRGSSSNSQTSLLMDGLLSPRTPSSSDLNRSCLAGGDRLNPVQVHRSHNAERRTQKCLSRPSLLRQSILRQANLINSAREDVENVKKVLENMSEIDIPKVRSKSPRGKGHRKKKHSESSNDGIQAEPNIDPLSELIQEEEKEEEDIIRDAPLDKFRELLSKKFEKINKELACNDQQTGSRDTISPQDSKFNTNTSSKPTPVVIASCENKYPTLIRKGSTMYRSLSDVKRFCDEETTHPDIGSKTSLQYRIHNSISATIFREKLQQFTSPCYNSECEYVLGRLKSSKVELVEVTDPGVPCQKDISTDRTTCDNVKNIQLKNKRQSVTFTSSNGQNLPKTRCQPRSLVHSENHKSHVLRCLEKESDKTPSCPELAAASNRGVDTKRHGGIRHPVFCREQNKGKGHDGDFHESTTAFGKDITFKQTSPARGDGSRYAKVNDASNQSDAHIATDSVGKVAQSPRLKSQTIRSPCRLLSPRHNNNSNDSPSPRYGFDDSNTSETNGSTGIPSPIKLTISGEARIITSWVDEMALYDEDDGSYINQYDSTFNTNNNALPQLTCKAHEQKDPRHLLNNTKKTDPDSTNCHGLSENVPKYTTLPKLIDRDVSFLIANELCSGTTRTPTSFDGQTKGEHGTLQNANDSNGTRTSDNYSPKCLRQMARAAVNVSSNVQSLPSLVKSDIVKEINKSYVISKVRGKDDSIENLCEPSHSSNSKIQQGSIISTGMEAENEIERRFTRKSQLIDKYNEIAVPRRSFASPAFSNRRKNWLQTRERVQVENTESYSISAKGCNRQSRIQESGLYQNKSFCVPGAHAVLDEMSKSSTNGNNNSSDVRPVYSNQICSSMAFLDCTVPVFKQQENTLSDSIQKTPHGVLASLSINLLSQNDRLPRNSNRNARYGVPDSEEELTSDTQERSASVNDNKETLSFTDQGHYLHRSGCVSNLYTSSDKNDVKLPVSRHRCQSPYHPYCRPNANSSNTKDKKIHLWSEVDTARWAPKISSHSSSQSLSPTRRCRICRGSVDRPLFSNPRLLDERQASTWRATFQGQESGNVEMPTGNQCFAHRQNNKRFDKPRIDMFDRGVPYAPTVENYWQTAMLQTPRLFPENNTVSSFNPSLPQQHNPSLESRSNGIGHGSKNDACEDNMEEDNEASDLNRQDVCFDCSSSFQRGVNAGISNLDFQRCLLSTCQQLGEKVDWTQQQMADGLQSVRGLLDQKLESLKRFVETKITKAELSEDYIKQPHVVSFGNSNRKFNSIQLSSVPNKQSTSWNGAEVIEAKCGEAVLRADACRETGETKTCSAPNPSIGSQNKHNIKHKKNQNIPIIETWTVTSNSKILGTTLPDSSESTSTVPASFSITQPVYKDLVEESSNKNIGFYPVENTTKRVKSSNDINAIAHGIVGKKPDGTVLSRGTKAIISKTTGQDKINKKRYRKANNTLHSKHRELNKRRRKSPMSRIKNETLKSKQKKTNRCRRKSQSPFLRQSQSKSPQPTNSTERHSRSCRRRRCTHGGVCNSSLPRVSKHDLSLGISQKKKIVQTITRRDERKSVNRPGRSAARQRRKPRMPTKQLRTSRRKKTKTKKKNTAIKKRNIKSNSTNRKSRTKKPSSKRPSSRRKNKNSSSTEGHFVLTVCANNNANKKIRAIRTTKPTTLLGGKIRNLLRDLESPRFAITRTGYRRLLWCLKNKYDICRRQLDTTSPGPLENSTPTTIRISSQNTGLCVSDNEYQMGQNGMRRIKDNPQNCKWAHLRVTKQSPSKAQTLTQKASCASNVSSSFNSCTRFCAQSSSFTKSRDILKEGTHNNSAYNPAYSKFHNSTDCFEGNDDAPCIESFVKQPKAVDSHRITRRRLNEIQTLNRRGEGPRRFQWTPGGHREPEGIHTSGGYDSCSDIGYKTFVCNTNQGRLSQQVPIENSQTVAGSDQMGNCFPPKCSSCNCGNDCRNNCSKYQPMFIMPRSLVKTLLSSPITDDESNNIVTIRNSDFGNISEQTRAHCSNQYSMSNLLTYPKSKMLDNRDSNKDTIRLRQLSSSRDAERGCVTCISQHTEAFNLRRDSTVQRYHHIPKLSTFMWSGEENLTDSETKCQNSNTTVVKSKSFCNSESKTITSIAHNNCSCSPSLTLNCYHNPNLTQLDKHKSILAGIHSASPIYETSRTSASKKGDVKSCGGQEDTSNFERNEGQRNMSSTLAITTVSKCSSLTGSKAFEKKLQSTSKTDQQITSNQNNKSINSENCINIAQTLTGPCYPIDTNMINKCEISALPHVKTTSHDSIAPSCDRPDDTPLGAVAFHTEDSADQETIWPKGEDGKKEDDPAITVKALQKEIVASNSMKNEAIPINDSLYVNNDKRSQTSPKINPPSIPYCANETLSSSVNETISTDVNVVCPCLSAERNNNRSQSLTVGHVALSFNNYENSNIEGCSNRERGEVTEAKRNNIVTNDVTMIHPNLTVNTPGISTTWVSVVDNSLVNYVRNKAVSIDHSSPGPSGIQSDAKLKKCDLSRECHSSSNAVSKRRVVQQPLVGATETNQLSTNSQASTSQCCPLVKNTVLLPNPCEKSSSCQFSSSYHVNSMPGAYFFGSSHGMDNRDSLTDNIFSNWRQSAQHALFPSESPELHRAQHFDANRAGEETLRSSTTTFIQEAEKDAVDILNGGQQTNIEKESSNLNSSFDRFKCLPPSNKKSCESTSSRNGSDCETSGSLQNGTYSYEISEMNNPDQSDVSWMHVQKYQAVQDAMDTTESSGRHPTDDKTEINNNATPSEKPTEKDECRHGEKLNSVKTLSCQLSNLVVPPAYYHVTTVVDDISPTTPCLRRVKRSPSYRNNHKPYQYLTRSMTAMLDRRMMNTQLILSSPSSVTFRRESGETKELTLPTGSALPTQTKSQQVMHGLRLKKPLNRREVRMFRRLSWQQRREARLRKIPERDQHGPFTVPSINQCETQAAVEPLVTGYTCEADDELSS